MDEMPFDHKMRIRFLLGFKDGNLFPEYVQQNAVKEVTARELEMIKASGAKVEVLGNVIPASTKKAAKE